MPARGHVPKEQPARGHVTANPAFGGWVPSIELTDEAVEAMDEPTRLQVLADWLDAKYPNDSSPEVQDFLRDLAHRIATGHVQAFTREQLMAIADNLTELDGLTATTSDLDESGAIDKARAALDAMERDDA